MREQKTKIAAKKRKKREYEMSESKISVR